MDLKPYIVIARSKLFSKISKLFDLTDYFFYFDKIVSVTNNSLASYITIYSKLDNKNNIHRWKILLF